MLMSCPLRLPSRPWRLRLRDPRRLCLCRDRLLLWDPSLPDDDDPDEDDPDVESSESEESSPDVLGGDPPPPPSPPLVSSLEL